MSRKAKGTTPAKTPEERRQERRDRFVKHAERRVNRAIKAIKAIANMANKASYDYTPDEADKIVLTLTEHMQGMLEKFAGVKDETSAFKLFE